MNLIVIIPAYNEERTVGEMIRECRMNNVECRIVVIDDGSKDRTREVARATGALVLRHPINRGLGAALATGIEAALRIMKHEAWSMKQDVIVTLDADGQHDPSEIPRLIEPIVRGEAEVVIGTRFKCKIENVKCKIPRQRIVANFCGNLFTWLLFGIWVSDSQSGFRAFSAEAAAKLKLRTSTMEVSSEIIREIVRLKLRHKEVPIAAHYTPYSLSKGQGFFRGIETLWKLIILRFFR